jgi:phosphonate transport system ATP-binding protein
VLSLLHRICKEDGLCAVVSLHQVDLARRYADRLVGLADGAVVFDGAPRELTGEDLAKIYDGANGEEEDAAADARQDHDPFVKATTEEEK